MGCGDVFEEEFKDWFESINNNAEKFLSRREKADIASIYKQIYDFRDIIDSYLTNIKLNQTAWMYGEKKPTIHPDVTYVFESLIESLYFLSLNLYHPANHAARCALEHIVITIHKIGFPARGPAKNHAQMRGGILGLPRYYEFNSCGVKLKIYKANKKYTLSEFMENTYHELSEYVHSSDAFRKSSNRDPVRTEDTSFKGKEYATTLRNIVDTLFIVIVMLSIALKEWIVKELDSLKKIDVRGINIREFFESAYFNKGDVPWSGTQALDI